MERELKRYGLSVPAARVFPVLAAALVALSFAAAPAFANDGGISFGGTPKLLAGRTSIRMESEFIRMDIHQRSVTTTADFVFMNTGEACTVRMGFPDQGVGVDNPDEEAGPNIMQKPARTTFTSFASYVNGKRTPTRLIRADQPGEYWHAKMVRFPAHQRLSVRDVYTQDVSGAIAAKGSYQTVAYIVHTGSSWHGNIGKSVLLAAFHRDIVPGKLRVQPAGSAVRDRDWTQVRRGTVMFHGFGTPAVSGRTLRFERHNWRPTTSDDLTLYFRTYF